MTREHAVIRRALRRPSVAFVVLALFEAELLAGPVRSAPLQVVLGLPLALLLPGVLLQWALFDMTTSRLGEWFLTALALSLGVLAIGGVILNALPVGIRPVTWLGYLAAVAVGVDLTTLVRKPPNSPFPSIHFPRPRPAGGS